ncbi:MAG: hypothetical protein ACKVT1_01285 [Dehalococcoidia bacterium]
MKLAVSAQRALGIASLVFAIGVCTAVVQHGGVENFPVVVAASAIPALGGLLALLQGSGVQDE